MTPEETRLLKQLTIVIPTYNRKLELEKIIEYWRDIPVTLHILDGSECAAFQNGRLPDIPNFSYHFFPRPPTENQELNVYRRLVFASSLPTTKYSAICCDDDFYTVSGLIESLKILEANFEIDAVAGRVATYQIRDSQIFWWMKYQFRRNVSSLSPSLKVRAMRKRDWFLYAICRTDLWSNFLRASYSERDFTWSNFGAHDWMMGIFSRAMFRTYFSEKIFLIRQITIKNKNLGPKVNFGTWLSENRETNEVKKIIEHLAETFGSVTAGDESSSNLALARHLVDNEIADTLRLNAAHEASILVSIIDALIASYKLLLRKIFLRFATCERRVAKRKRRLRLFVSDLISLGYLSSGSELFAIEDLLLKPREELRLRANI